MKQVLASSLNPISLKKMFLLRNLKCTETFHRHGSVTQ
jgi:hypothetical protein